ncbi:MAG: GNAT family N-acetyltransferase [Defluviitaleaceae bacterium]|nr:GNAT family N-acetyltransferase [Defluviitaleaceae bacterium]
MSSIKYTTDINDITAEMLDGGFFVGWPNPPCTDVHLKILQNAYCFVVAIDEATGKVIGFVNAISDGVLSAYIPLLEVLPEYKGRGIGKRLVEIALEKLDGLYMIDICHDDDVTAFYKKLGAFGCKGSVFRNHAAQSGRLD